MEYEIQKHLHYAGIPSFNLYPYTQDTECADITIMGVPFDSGVTNRPGARLGPRAISNMSQLTLPTHGATNSAIKQRSLITAM